MTTHISGCSLIHEHPQGFDHKPYYCTSSDRGTYGFVKKKCGGTPRKSTDSSSFIIMIHHHFHATNSWRVWRGGPSWLDHPMAAHNIWATAITTTTGTYWAWGKTLLRHPNVWWFWGWLYEIGSHIETAGRWWNWWGPVGVSKASASFLSALLQVVTSLRRGLSAPWQNSSKVGPISLKKTEDSFHFFALCDVFSLLGFKVSYFVDGTLNQSLVTNALVLMEKCSTIFRGHPFCAAEESFEIHRGQRLCCWARLAMHPQGQSSRLTENGENPQPTQQWSKIRPVILIYWKLLVM